MGPRPPRHPPIKPPQGGRSIDHPTEQLALGAGHPEAFEHPDVVRQLERIVKPDGALAQASVGIGYRFGGKRSIERRGAHRAGTWLGQEVTLDLDGDVAISGVDQEIRTASSMALEVGREPGLCDHGHLGSQSLEGQTASLGSIVDGYGHQAISEQLGEPSDDRCLVRSALLTSTLPRFIQLTGIWWRDGVIEGVLEPDLAANGRVGIEREARGR